MKRTLSFLCLLVIFFIGGIATSRADTIQIYRSETTIRIYQKLTIHTPRAVFQSQRYQEWTFTYRCILFTPQDISPFSIQPSPFLNGANGKYEHGRRLVARADWTEDSPVRGGFAMLGQNHQHPNGLLNEGHRYRDRTTNTFLTRDPLGYIDGPNDYNNVRHNPWSAWDPNGLALSLANNTKDIGYTDNEIAPASDTTMHSTGYTPAYQYLGTDSFLDWAKTLYGENMVEVMDYRYQTKIEPLLQLRKTIHDAEKIFFDSYMTELGRPPMPSEEAAFVYELARLADEHGYQAMRAMLWEKRRNLQDEERQGVYRTAAFEVITALVMMAADGPLPFGDAASARRTLSLAAESSGNAANSVPQRAFWIGREGQAAALEQGYQVMTPSQRALAAANQGDYSLMRAESAAWASGARGEVPVFVGQPTKAVGATPTRGDIFFQDELPQLLNNVNDGNTTIRYYLLK